MGKNSKPTIQKREKEKARQQRQRDKDARRAESKAKAPSVRPENGDDPDLAGIVPGPQPLPPEFGRTFRED